MINKPNFNLFTVPHSGTHFTMEYFRQMGIRTWNPSSPSGLPTFWQVHAGNNYLGRMTLDNYKRLCKHPTVITVTHPYRCWISFTGRNKSYEENVDCWHYLLDTMPKLNYYLFDINCRKTDRKDTLVKMMNYLGLYNEDRDRWINKWVDRWPIEAAQEYKNKAQYLKDGTLPSGYDYDQLQFAVDWYESLPSNDY